MKNMKPQTFMEILGSERASAIIRTDKQETAAKAMDAAIRGGFRIVEFTLTIPGAFELISEFSKRPDIVVGAGTVLTIEDARKSRQSGAHFLVSPVVDEIVIREAHSLELAVIPGTQTPTEMWKAHQLGAQCQKLFPAPGTGPEYVRSTLAPMPFLKLVPTNGITLENAAEYLRAGAFAVGFVKALFDADDLRSGNFDRTRDRAAQCLASIRNR
ncbi:MAG: 2-dehydro-3-deoxyphosphogluconate aldolase [Acidobacteria bacterium]|nr:MAG: 2-dehydro-3-deoxyphosphogluconate aldolase [Acidobacteriota bacterium]